MTIACGVADGGQVILGGDSALSTDGGDQSIGQPKVFERDGMLFGCSGELRVAQLVRHVFELPVCGEQDPERYMIRDFARQLHDFLKTEADNLLPGLDDEDELWSLLVGVKGRLFRICSHLSVSESATGYDAIGSGTPFSLGSFASTEGRPARDRVELALAAAERHVSSVSRPFSVLQS